MTPEKVGPNGEVPGTKVELISTTDPWTKLKTGDKGTVDFVDAMGTVHCRWESGSFLGLIHGKDRWKVIS